jgi:hypothetical protein
MLVTLTFDIPEKEILENIEKSKLYKMPIERFNVETIIRICNNYNQQSYVSNEIMKAFEKENDSKRQIELLEQILQKMIDNLPY